MDSVTWCIIDKLYRKSYGHFAVKPLQDAPLVIRTMVLFWCLSTCQSLYYGIFTKSDHMRQICIKVILIVKYLQYKESHGSHSQILMLLMNFLSAHESESEKVACTHACNWWYSSWDHFSRCIMSEYIIHSFQISNVASWNQANMNVLTLINSVWANDGSFWVTFYICWDFAECIIKIMQKWDFCVCLPLTSGHIDWQWIVWPLCIFQTKITELIAGLICRLSTTRLYGCSFI